MQCRKQMSLWLGDKEELLKQLLDWAFGGFKPAGPDRVPPAVGGESPLVSPCLSLTNPRQRLVYTYNTMRL